MLSRARVAGIAAGVAQMLTRRENALNLMGELGQEVPEFTLRASLREDPAQVGARLRQAIGVSVEAQLAWSTSGRRGGVAGCGGGFGVFVYQFIKVSLSEVRGLALLRTPCR